jgi:hypothetical protein
MRRARRGIITTIALLVVAVSVDFDGAIAFVPDGAILSGTTLFQRTRMGEVFIERQNLARSS